MSSDGDVTCLDDLEEAVAVWMEVVGDFEARAVVVVESSPHSLRVCLDARLLLLILLLQPMVAEQQLGREFLFEPGSEANGHEKPVGPGGGGLWGDATGRV